MTVDTTDARLTEVRCCCDPSNLIGYLPSTTEDLTLRTLTDGTQAFDSDHDAEGIRSRPDFVPADEQAAKKPKQWRKK